MRAASCELLPVCFLRAASCELLPVSCFTGPTPMRTRTQQCLPRCASPMCRCHAARGMFCSQTHEAHSLARAQWCTAGAMRPYISLRAMVTTDSTQETAPRTLGSHTPRSFARATACVTRPVHHRQLTTDSALVPSPLHARCTATFAWPLAKNLGSDNK